MQSVVLVGNSDAQNAFSLLINGIFKPLKKKIKERKNADKKNIKQIIKNKTLLRFI